MSFGCCRRILYLSLVVFFIISSLLQIWCQAGAIRILSGNAMANVNQQNNNIISNSNKITDNNNNNNNDDKKKKKKKSTREEEKELLHKYFKERAFGFNRTEEKGFEDDKRRVPSCPDPLHN